MKTNLFAIPILASLIVSLSATVPSQKKQRRVATNNQRNASSDYEVGIIPGADGCPGGADPLTIFMDDEDTDNHNASSGWFGQINNNRDTTFKFCEVDGSRFVRLFQGTYAVLQLSYSCPPGSKGYSRKFHNQRWPNQNWASDGIYPNESHNWPASYTLLNFCLFQQRSGWPQSATVFPDFGVEYGVFALDDFHLAAGLLYTDDENTQNHNALSVYDPDDHFFIADVNRLIWGGDNTYMRIAIARSPRLPYGSACQGDAECISGICYAGKVCGNPLGAASTCTRDFECAEHLCVSGTCRKRNALGYSSICQRDEECGNNVCYALQTCGNKLSLTSGCYRDWECSSNHCDGGNINASPAQRGTCTPP